MNFNIFDVTVNDDKHNFSKNDLKFMAKKKEVKLKMRENLLTDLFSKISEI